MGVSSNINKAAKYKFRMVSRIFLWGLLISGSGWLGPIQAAEADNIFGIDFPDSFEEMFDVVVEDPATRFIFRRGYVAYFFQDVQQYEDPRLGYSVLYASAPGTWITVYVYTRGIENIPDGKASSVVTEELARSIDEVEASDQYTSANEGETEAPLSENFQQRFHKLITQQGQTLNSYTLLRGQNDRFIKMRISSPSSISEGRVTAFIEALSEDLEIEVNQAR